MLSGVCNLYSNPVKKYTVWIAVGVILYLLLMCAACTTAPDHRIDLRMVPDESRQISWQPLFKGVSYYAEHVSTIPFSVYVIQVEVFHPNVFFFVTPSNGDERLDTNSLRTSSFLSRYKLQVAINASPFNPIHFFEGLPTDVVGLSISEGNLYSEPEGNRDVLLIFSNKRPEITKPSGDYENVAYAVGGFSVVLRSGIVVGKHKSRHPRTGVGISEDGEMLYLMVIDGRQPFHSVGATLFELGCWLRYVGASTAINLDGGGSSTLVIQAESGRPKFVNKPIGYGSLMIERAVGNHFGIRAEKIK